MALIFYDTALNITRMAINWVNEHPDEYSFIMLLYVIIAYMTIEEKWRNSTKGW